MHRFACIVWALPLWLVVVEPAPAAVPRDSYARLKQQIAQEGLVMRQQWAAEADLTRRQRHSRLEHRLLGRIDRLFGRWLGSRWGLGMPQSLTPGVGKTNCGLFVATVLRDAGFRLPIWKFNRQASYDAIKSLAPRRAMRYLHGKSMAKFVAGVRKMGPGLYLIGLDFHIGFLRLHDDERGLRFVHASYLTRTVVDEPARDALAIRDSRYRVVGKILQPNMLRAWLARRRIKVLGTR